MGLAAHVARRFGRRGPSDDDLRQVAFLALVKAVDRFEPDRNVAFSTFAGRTIEGEIKRHFRDHTWTVRVPRSAKETHLRLRRATDELTQQLGRSPTVPQLAEHLGISTDEVVEGIAAGSAYTTASLDAPDGRRRRRHPPDRRRGRGLRPRRRRHGRRARCSRRCRRASRRSSGCASTRSSARARSPSASGSPRCTSRACSRRSFEQMRRRGQGADVDDDDRLTSNLERSPRFHAGLTRRRPRSTSCPPTPRGRTPPATATEPDVPLSSKDRRLLRTMRPVRSRPPVGRAPQPAGASAAAGSAAATSCC